MKIITPALGYALVSGVAVAIGLILWGYFSTPTYQVVTVFIGSITVSNCFAKLYTIYLNL